MAAEPDLQAEHYAAALEQQVRQLEQRVLQAEERRRALLHIMGDLNESNRKLGDQRKAMLHILGDYEEDRSRLALVHVRATAPASDRGEARSSRRSGNRLRELD